ncbi:MAG TPA: hypothetical protein VIC51_12735, partial [Psychromonas sp.]
MKNRDDFAVFILTHGRPENVMTYKALKKQGYTGRIVLLVDDEDKSKNEYKKIYGKEVFIFSKQDAIDITDSGDNFNKRGSVVYVRNYSFVVAKKLGIKYFVQFDDDYTAFRYTFDNHKNYITKQIKINNLDAVLSAMLDFYIQSGVKTVAMSQGGDFIGGEGSNVAKLYKQGKLPRKAMNSFFCSTDRPFKFYGIFNDDVNSYLLNGVRGDVFVTYPRIRLEQADTQQNDGALTELY